MNFILTFLLVFIFSVTSYAKSLLDSENLEDMIPPPRSCQLFFQPSKPTSPLSQRELYNILGYDRDVKIMVKNAVDYLTKLKKSSGYELAILWEQIARVIETDFYEIWTCNRVIASNGNIIYYGLSGPFLIFTVDGKILKGFLPQNQNVTSGEWDGKDFFDGTIIN